MKKLFLVFSFFFLSLTQAFASENVGQIKEQFITELVQKNIIEQSKSQEAKSLIPSVDYQRDIAKNYADYFTWDLLKYIGILFFIVAFGKLIWIVGASLFLLILQVPMFVYQALAGALTLSASFANYWVTSAYFVEYIPHIVFFGVIGNILVALWVASVYKQIMSFIERLFSLNMPEIALSFWATVYFGAFYAMTKNSALGLLSFMGMIALVASIVSKVTGMKHYYSIFGVTSTAFITLLMTFEQISMPVVSIATFYILPFILSFFLFFFEFTNKSKIFVAIVTSLTAFAYYIWTQNSVALPAFIILICACYIYAFGYMIFKSYKAFKSNMFSTFLTGLFFYGTAKILQNYWGLIVQIF